nr:MAG TPA: hypothetical protein [Caudoviricetes sp.]
MSSTYTFVSAFLVSRFEIGKPRKAVVYHLPCAGLSARQRANENGSFFMP